MPVFSVEKPIVVLREFVYVGSANANRHEGDRVDGHGQLLDCRHPNMTAASDCFRYVEKFHV